MSNPEKITPEIKEPERENLLPKKIRDGLNKIRESGISFHEKAEKLFLLLKEANCQEIKILDCDVCIDDFYPEFFQKISEVYPKEFELLSSDEQQKIHQKMNSLIPEQAKVRVHAETLAGCFTYCFGCESTMCGNEVEYPENSDWNELHKKRAREILLNHPEWPINKFNLSGSTRNRVCIDVISSDPEFEFHQFDIDDMHISINLVSETILKNIPQIEEQFESLKF
ncbi:MAG: hypothetical protein ABIJ83_01525 [Patescibacteria group bacterium]|nr:hypothetical protein [Patescibacteria group bacterium]MBU2081423.1 hypothetical protein [Patescibacteria group bacterium]MBU2214902.1 hypothetical protein [Patescibacteria group bacterium]MBU2249985.1 hypothetical protein [Patescibacteria group bacterium]